MGGGDGRRGGKGDKDYSLSSPRWKKGREKENPKAFYFLVTLLRIRRGGGEKKGSFP